MHTDPITLFAASDSPPSGMPAGQPDGDGTADRPLSLEGARDRIRQWKQQGAYPAGGVAIRLLPGDYRLLTSLRLTPRDSGRPDAPVTWRADQAGTVRLLGSRLLSGFEPVSDPAIRARLPEGARDAVVQVDLKALGIDDAGQWRPRGHGGGSANAALELFSEQGPLPPARWPKASRFPNRGFEAIAAVRGDRLVYTDPRPARWAAGSEIYLHGFFSRDWASTIVRVTELDGERQEIAVDPPRAGPYGIKAGGRFYYFNVLEELSEPGEWVLDRDAGRVYLWLPTDAGAIEASVLDAPLIVLNQVEDVRFDDLMLAAPRGDGISISGGQRIRVGGCQLMNIGRAAVRITGGRGHEILGCDIWNIGESGVEIHDAGDRRHGEACRHRVENCHLHHIAREGWTYFESVRILNSCGVIVARNRFNDHPHAMIHYRGNDHVIERNEFYNFTLLGDDCGCMYYGRDFTLQGHVIRNNYLHHAGDSGRNDWGSAGVYNDDGGGGSEVVGNIFHYVNKGVLAGGGINMRIHHNLFSRCEPAIWFDQRLASAQADRGDTMMHEFMRGLFYDLEAHVPPFAARYAGMDTVHDALQRGVGIEPLNAQVRGNLILGGRGRWLHTHWSELPEYFDYADNEEADETTFPDAAFGDFELPADHALCRRTGYRPIPLRDIGVYRDERFRPEIESVRTALEIVRPLGRRGEPGRIRLRLRNDGDLPVRGIEFIEIKRRAHGPGFAHIEVPFESRPGIESAVEVDVILDPAELGDAYEVVLHSRGERIRPAWTVLPLACPLETHVEGVEALTWGSDVAPGRVRLRILNRADQPVSAAVSLTVEPAGAVTVEPDRWTRSLAPREQMVEETIVRWMGAAQGLHSRITVRSGGPDTRPDQTILTVRYPIRSLNGLPSLSELPLRLANEPVLPACRKARLTRDGHYGDFRLAAAEGHLLMDATINDPRIAVSPLLWDGSCVEVFACSPDRERIGHVFGAIEIGQVYLVPACGGEPPKGYRFQHNQAVPKPNIQVASEPGEAGYRLRAMIPFTELALPADVREFLFEIQVTVSPPTGHPGESRGNLFGSESAFNDTSRYALACLR